MLIAIANLKNEIIFYQNFNKIQSPLDYLLINAAIETEECLTANGYSVQSKLFPSGHKLFISHRIEQKIDKKLINLIDHLFLEEMLNPYVTKELSEEFKNKLAEKLN
jgi:hypothetical protein